MGIFRNRANNEESIGVLEHLTFAALDIPNGEYASRVFSNPQITNRAVSVIQALATDEELAQFRVQISNFAKELAYPAKSSKGSLNRSTLEKEFSVQLHRMLYLISKCNIQDREHPELDASLIQATIHAFFCLFDSRKYTDASNCLLNGSIQTFAFILSETR
jgi:hypothetical protein